MASLWLTPSSSLAPRLLALSVKNERAGVGRRWDRLMCREGDGHGLQSVSGKLHRGPRGSLRDRPANLSVLSPPSPEEAGRTSGQFPQAPVLQSSARKTVLPGRAGPAGRSLPGLRIQRTPSFRAAAGRGQTDGRRRDLPEMWQLRPLGRWSFHRLSLRGEDPGEGWRLGTGALAASSDLLDGFGSPERARSQHRLAQHPGDLQLVVDPHEAVVRAADAMPCRSTPCGQFSRRRRVP